ncbi:MAG: VPLPA-CTERM-specific exosortase XrtD [Gammaproteobacteria bacterium]|nr:VPLPA-CTERM-specific exosortase XrtD [Gammaproteobacteria bacterium]
MTKIGMPLAAGLIVALFTSLVFWDGLVYMVDSWDREEYNHGYLIPVVAAYLLWLRAEKFNQMQFSASWTGALVVLMSLGAFVLGELSSIFQIIEYGFLLAIFGLILSSIGWSGFRLVWVPFVYLIFMVPLPNFVYQGLSAELQLISSEIGVAVIRLFGISVFLEGNVIDLGVYQLQVAEACNGLRYLFPLMSFGFLCAAIFVAPWWQRAIVFLSTIPVTILMNSFRIGVIGVLVENYGIDQAEGFLHYFEGWIVFMACVGILFLEMWFFAWIAKRPLMEVFALDIPEFETAKALLPTSLKPQFMVAAVIMMLGVLLSFTIQTREMLIPERSAFNTFPLIIDRWTGRDSVLEDESVINALAADDYFLAEYRNRDDGAKVGLWVAYYEEQRKGRAVHSPRACLPGGGWKIESFDDYTLTNMGPNGEDYVINRAVIGKGEFKQLVYFWFVERGKIQTNEYLVKWSIFWDALTKNRTDGALVRLTTFVPDVSMMGEAEEQLQSFARSLNPKLAYHLPQEDATFRGVAPEADQSAALLP